MKCFEKFYVMQVSMTQQPGDSWKLIFTTITQNTMNFGRLLRFYSDMYPSHTSLCTLSDEISLSLMDGQTGNKGMCMCFN